MLERQDTEDLITEEELNRELQQECLKRLRNYLCEHLEPERFFPYLQSKEYLDTDSCEQIRNAGTTRTRVNKMLDILIKSGPQPLEVLIRAIKRCGTTQKFIVAKLEEGYKKLRDDPKNIDRLLAIRSNVTQHAHLHPTYRESPPPYTMLPGQYFYPPGMQYSQPYQSYMHTSGEWFHPSRFPTGPSTPDDSKNFLRSKSQEPVPTTVPSSEADFRGRSISDGIQNQRPGQRPLINPDENQGMAQQNNMTDIGKIPNNTLPGDSSATSSDMQQSLFDGNASHFQTSDFVTLSDPGELIEIVSLQAEQEQKVSLRNSSSDDDRVISDELVSSQEKQFSKYEVTLKPEVPEKKWFRASRTPSEHDSSVVCTRPTALSNTSECTNDSQTSVKLPPNGTNIKYMRSPATSPIGKRMTTQQSCQNGSIQPSCFTSSNFEDVNTSPQHMEVTDKKVLSPRTRSRSPLLRSPFNLETIPSLDSPSSSESSIKIRRPPTEHEDTSVTTQSTFNHDDDDDSSLEISTDSDVSDHQ